MAEAADRRMSTRATGVVGAAILCSRVLGLVRETVFAGSVRRRQKSRRVSDGVPIAEFVARLFAEGALSTAFITTFSKKIATEGDESAWRLANKVATLTAVFMSGVTLLGIVFAPQLVDLLTWGSWSPDKTALTILLTRIMWPFMLLVSLAALVMGMLNAKHVFGPPAMASSYFNLGSIIGGVAIGWWLDPQFGARSLIGLAIGTLIGGAVAIVGAISFTAASRLQISRRFSVARRRGAHRADFDGAGGDRGQRGAGERADQQRICGESGQRAGELAQHRVSSDAIAAGNFRRRHRHRYACRWYQRALRVGNTDEFRAILAHGMRLAFLLTIPSAIGLAMLASPIISVIYQHGRFTAEMTRQTAGALQFYAIGLVSYSALKVLTPAFYAIGKRNTPMVVSFLAIGTNLVSELVVHISPWLGTSRPGFFHQPRGHDQFPSCSTR